MRIAVEEGKAANPALHLGICGEHGGDPASVVFCHELGLDYVSCSPFPRRDRAPGRRPGRNRQRRVGVEVGPMARSGSGEGFDFDVLPLVAGGLLLGANLQLVALLVQDMKIAEVAAEARALDDRDRKRALRSEKLADLHAVEVFAAGAALVPRPDIGPALWPVTVVVTRTISSCWMRMRPRRRTWSSLTSRDPS